jgi:hypothetical protein
MLSSTAGTSQFEIRQLMGICRLLGQLIHHNLRQYTFMINHSGQYANDGTFQAFSRLIKYFVLYPGFTLCHAV